MTNISKVAAIACCAIVTIGMTGCNNSSSTTTTSADTPAGDTPVAPPVVIVEDTCTVPDTATDLATLDQNKTADILGAALISEELGYMISDGSMRVRAASEKSAEEPKEVSKLASAVSVQIKTLQENTADVKKTISALGDGSLIYGDDVACDAGGTYTLHETGSGSFEDGVDTEMTQLTLSFNECVMEDTGDNEMLSFFRQVTLYNSIINYAAGRTYTFNGSLTMEYDADYTYTYDSWNDDPAPTDYGYDSESTDKGSSTLVTDGISVEVKEDGVVSSLFTSTKELSVMFDNTYSNGGLTTYETDYNEGNYTSTYYNKSQDSWTATLEGSESEQIFGDENITITFSACNFSAEGTSEYNYNSYNNYEEYSQVSYGNTNDYTTNTTLSGYITMQDSSGGLDLYADALMGSFADSYAYHYDYNQGQSESNNTSEISLDGTVGSTLIGGSVVLDTQSPWLMSSEYPDHRYPMEPVAIGLEYGVYVDYSPYTGKTVLTGTNSATVEFMLDDQNMTYGTITVGDEEPVEYDSIEDMGIAYID